MSSREANTSLLTAAAKGDGAAATQLVGIVYDDLRRIAAARLRHERAGHSLCPTDLVHEAYMRLIDQREVDWGGERHFRAVAAMIMRRVLTDHARKKAAAKRGGGWERITLDSSIGEFDQGLDAIAVGEALQKLQDIDPKLCQIVELRFFGGLTESEVGAILGQSERSVRKQWAWAKAWLRRTLDDGVASDD
jgi:RNA polymerase sigma factor (TIGR02999 family)